MSKFPLSVDCSWASAFVCDSAQVSFDFSTKYLNDLCEVDEAMSLLEKDDQDRLDQEMKSAANAEVDRKSFLETFRGKCKEIIDKNGGGPKKKAKKNGVAVPQQKWTAEVPFEEAKALKPPDASLWRGFNRGEYWGHCKPYSRVVASWAKHGSECNALQHVLRSLWRQSLEKQGLDTGSCPVLGLF